MENSNVKQNKKGKNKGKRTVIQLEVTRSYNSWNNRISSLRVWNEALISVGEQVPETITTTVLTKEKETLEGVQPQQAPTSTDAPQPAAKPEVAPLQDGAAPKGSSQQAATPTDLVAPKDVVLKIVRQTENLQPEVTLKVASPKVSGDIGGPQQVATPTDLPQKIDSGSHKEAPQEVATSTSNANVVPKDVPLKGATPKLVKVVRWKDLEQELTIQVAPQQAAATPENTPSGAAQQVCEAYEMIRGPVQRKTLWKAPPPYRTLRDASPKVSGQVGAAQPAGEASELTRGPVQRKTLWKPTQPHRAPKHEGLARVWAGKVEAGCYKRGPVQRKKLWTPTPPSPQEHSGGSVTMGNLAGQHHSSAYWQTQFQGKLRRVGMKPVILKAVLCSRKISAQRRTSLRPVKRWRLPPSTP
ncbi:nascent polypeptide-associated complex subunit alpha, muscle-specific form-like [Etheostoma spectabile]|uniref:nascent polypeptide-associated complex subunit alpha, muscle-specific form-like n=1 Tax=Etheostoma spectabile TaxID=54343 RepID=UPI0013AF6704|nr:nascent polypeptide-associated complex subunit alpha, muscle-specific form-like [Etheostoma spectabile]